MAVETRDIGVDSSSRQPQLSAQTPDPSAPGSLPAGTHPDLVLSGTIWPSPSGSFWTMYHPFALLRITNTAPLICQLKPFSGDLVRSTHTPTSNSSCLSAMYGYIATAYVTFCTFPSLSTRLPACCCCCCSRCAFSPGAGDGNSGNASSGRRTGCSVPAVMEGAEEAGLVGEVVVSVLGRTLGRTLTLESAGSPSFTACFFCATLMGDWISLCRV